MSDTPSERKFRLAVRRLLAANMKPTPKLLGEIGYGNGRTLGGNRSIIRREEFARAGWRQDVIGGIWYKP